MLINISSIGHNQPVCIPQIPNIMVKYLPMFTSTVYITYMQGCILFFYLPKKPVAVAWSYDTLLVKLVSPSNVWSASLKAFITHSVCYAAVDLMSWLNREFPDICSLSAIQLSEWWKNRFQSLCFCVKEALFFSFFFFWSCACFDMHTLYLHIWVALKKKDSPSVTDATY